ncbi:MAG: GMC family oxidoreductase N-terminal domain-containing protein, partial [Myxococcales bacterium]|nr:GMC family oxidoreductase N-terminal domain-containing protein [Myxococcales bacterium]
MGVSFFETMRGTLRAKDGPEQPVEFEIKAEASHLPRFLRDGTARLSGLIEAPPFVTRAAIDGRIRISILRERIIAYVMSFHDDNDRPCTLEGTKHLTPWHPFVSSSEMDVTLRREGIELAQGHMAFDFRTLIPFLRSWTPMSSIRRLDAGQRDGAERAPILTDDERLTLRALAEAMLPAGRHVPADDDTTVAETERVLSALPGEVRRGWRLALRALDARARLRHRRRFRELSTEARYALLADWLLAPPGAERPPASLKRLSIELLTTVIKGAHFGRADYLAAIGHPPERTIAREPEPRYLQRVIEAESLEPLTEVHAEVVVVGSGAGGAAVAASLARQGVAVAIVEEGRYFRRHDFGGSPVARLNAMYRYKSFNFTLGASMMVPVGRTVGGSTTINSGTCFATPDRVLEEWRSELGFPDDFRPSHYHRYSEQVARMLQVAPGSPAALGRIADVIARGADAMGLSHGPLARNAPSCTGAGECVMGCPEGAKRSADVTWIPAALEAGAELYVGLPATRILMRGPRAVAIEARGADRNGVARTLRVFADHIVLACGSLHTPIMLRENGFTLPQIGRNLSVHPAIGLTALMDEDINPWKTIP